MAGIVAFYILTKGDHPFGEKPDRLRNLLDGKPVGLDTMEDNVVKDLISWMLSHDPNNRPSPSAVTSGSAETSLPSACETAV